MDKSISRIIDKETAAFTGSVKLRLSTESNPFTAEAKFLADFRQTTESEFEKNWAKLLTGNDFLPPDTGFYYTEFQKCLYPEGIHPAPRRFSSVLEHFCDRWEAALFHKISQWELAFIDAMRREFLKELYQKIGTLKRLGELLIPDSSGAAGRLWDMNKSKWEKLDFTVLYRYAELLENDIKLRELCEKLGRTQTAKITYEEELFTETHYIPDLNSEYSQKAEITGIHQSNDLESIIPAEIALLADPQTESVFLKKYLEKKLLAWEYQTKMFAFREVRTKSKRLKVKEYRGPFIICLDTSGSMHGRPETIAKTICFALLKIALRDHRPCYLISFSTGIETLDVSNINDNIDRLISFLAMAFHGGTDANTAMRESLRMLGTDSFRKADIIVISDFIMGAFETDLLEKIAREKKRNTAFHSLVIGKSANKNVLECFDYVWSYERM
ncbi:MAG: VWA domain-containing protein [Treponema sp.]|jgi:uncharacterized protein with von Willebrand factor type A (vWA) domain|nr:VWA domain-containing protein [Treponema sp.]